MSSPSPARPTAAAPLHGPHGPHGPTSPPCPHARRAPRRRRLAEPFGAPGLRAAAYALVSLPLDVAALLGAPFGGGRRVAAARARLDAALLPGGAPARTRGLAGRSLLGRSLLGLPLDLAAWALAVFSAFNTARNLGYPLWYGRGDYHDAWGGPTLAGVWAVHALGWLACLYAVLWLLLAWARGQRRLAGRPNAGH